MWRMLEEQKGTCAHISWHTDNNVSNQINQPLGHPTVTHFNLAFGARERVEGLDVWVWERLSARGFLLQPWVGEEVRKITHRGELPDEHHTGK